MFPRRRHRRLDIRLVLLADDDGGVVEVVLTELLSCSGGLSPGSLLHALVMLDCKFNKYKKK